MSIWVGRLQAQQPHREAQVDAAVEPAAERAAHPGFGDEPATRPQMNREDRLFFTAYVVMEILIVLFLATTGLVWWLGG